MRRRVMGHASDRGRTETRGRCEHLARVFALTTLVVVTTVGALLTSGLGLGVGQAPDPRNVVVSAVDTGALPAHASDPVAGAVDRGLGGEAGGQMGAQSVAPSSAARRPGAPEAATATHDAGARAEGEGGVRPAGSKRNDVDPLSPRGGEPEGVPGVRPPTGPLFAPDAGVRVIAPPTLTWEPVANVRGYRLRLFRGASLVLDERMAQPGLELHREWRYAGRRFTLTPGPYRWSVWRVPESATSPSQREPLKVSSFTVLVPAG